MKAKGVYPPTIGGSGGQPGNHVYSKMDEYCHATSQSELKFIRVESLKGNEGLYDQPSPDARPRSQGMLSDADVPIPRFAITRIVGAG